jgi:hypothetical protein
VEDFGGLGDRSKLKLFPEVQKHATLISDRIGIPPGIGRPNLKDLS